MKLTVKLDFGSGYEIKVGTFSEIARDTAFEFTGEFLSSGLNIAPFRLPPSGGLKVYDRSGNMETFGLFDDSLPDGWGRRIVDRMFMKREGRLPTITERLMCVGRSGKGALVYEPADEAADAANAAEVPAERGQRRMSGTIPRQARCARKIPSCRWASSIGSSSSTRGAMAMRQASWNIVITKRRLRRGRKSRQAVSSRRKRASSS